MQRKTRRRIKTMENQNRTILTDDGGQEINNLVMLHGEIVGEPTYSHEVFGEGFYDLTLAVNRLSEMQDMIPITLPERLIREEKITDGMKLTVKGQFRSYNKLMHGRSKLMLTVFVREIIKEPSPENPNIIEIVGHVCKAPIYRTTPFNREIADILLAVNRAYNKSDYLPAIAWGRNARFAKNMVVGEKVYLSGRIQSREYQKRLDDGTVEPRLAYEVSINKLSNQPLESQIEITKDYPAPENNDMLEEMFS